MSSSSSSTSSLHNEVTPTISPGDLVVLSSQDEEEDIAFTILEKLGSVGCCDVYSGRNVQIQASVLLKFFRPGLDYEEALQRESFVLDTFSGPEYNIVHCYGCLTYQGLPCLVFELLGDSIGKIILENDRKGLSPWVTVKFAKDLLTTLQALHQAGFVHGDLTPAHILWSTADAGFKCIDFSHCFSIHQQHSHPLQSEGYRSPEAAEWNTNLEDQKLSRRRRLRGSFNKLNILCPALYRHAEAGDIETSNDNLMKNNKLAASDNEVSNEIFEKQEREENLSCEYNERLLHSDSISSGIYSQDSSGRSRCSSCLSWDEESRPIHKAKSPSLYQKMNTLADNVAEEIDYEDPYTQHEFFDEGPKLQRFSVIYEQKPSLIQPPSTPIDIWSFGCLLVEVLTGRKLFQTGDKLASVLRPGQLLEMKLGETEVAWTERGEEVLFDQIKNLILKCIYEDPNDRITANEALKHSVFSQSPKPSVEDFQTLPICLSHLPNEESYSDIHQIIKNDCEEYDKVLEFQDLKNGHLFVHFQEEAWFIL